MDRKNEILELRIEFSLLIIALFEKLEMIRKYLIANQLIRLGTSIRAIIHEAQSSESKQHFIHKLKIAAKEATETEYWLSLCNKSENYPSTDRLLEKLLPIQKILSKIISTTKKSIK